MKKEYIADFALFMVAIMWGLSFIIMKNALAVIEVFNLLGIRFIAAALICMVIFFKQFRTIDLVTIKRGIFIGFFLFAGYAVQTYGLNFTTASKSAFITGFTVVLVPVLTPIIMKQFPGISEIMAAIIAFIGIGCLSLTGDINSINKGDVLTLLGAFAFAFQIILIGKFAKTSNNINSAIVQIAFVGVLSTIISLLLGTFTIQHQPNTWGAVLFLSVFCTAYSFVVQNMAQKHTTPARTSLIFTFEPVSAPIFAYFLLGEVLTPLGMFGAVLVILGMLLSELDLIGKLKAWIKTTESEV